MASYDLQAARAAGVSDDDIASALASRTNYDLAGAKSAGIPMPEIVDALVSKFNSSNPAGRGEYLASKFAGGGAALLGFPGEVLSHLVYPAGRALRKGLSSVIPGYESAVPAVEPMSPVSAAKQVLGVPKLEAPDTATRYAGAVAEFAGGNVLPGAAILSRAAHVAPAATGLIGSTVLGGIGSEAGGDIASAAGAPRFAGELIGGILGSVYGGAPSALASKVRGVLGAQAGPQYAARELEKHVSAHPFVGETMAQSDEVIGKISQAAGRPFTPTLGERTGAAGVLALQDDIASRSAKGVERAMSNRDQNVLTLQAAKESIFPSGASIQRAAGQSLLKTEAALDQKVKQLETLQEQIASGLPVANQKVAGERLIQLRDEAFTVAQTVKKEKLKDLYDTAKGVSISADDMAATTAKLIDSDSATFQKLPTQLRATVQKWTPEGSEAAILGPKGETLSAKQVSFEEFHSAWRETNRQMGQAIRQGDAQSIHFLGQLKSILQGKLDAIEASGQGDVARKLADFNSFYRTRYAPVFRQGVGGRMVAQGRFGDQMKPEDVVSSFFTPSGLDDFAAIYGSNEAAQRTLKDGVIGMFAQHAVRDGVLDPKRAASFMRDNAEALSRIPDVKSLLSSQAEYAGALMERNARLVAGQKQLGQSTLAEIAGTKDIGQWVLSHINDPSALKQLLAIPNQSAKQTALRAVADAIPKAASRAGMTPTQFLSENQASLKPLLDAVGPQHFDNVKTIAGALEMMGRWKVPSSPDPRGLLVDPLEAAIGTSIPSAISQYRATTITRQSSPVYMASSMGTKFLNKLRKARGDKIIEEAFYDPAVAKELKAGLRSGIVSNRLRDQLIAYGVVSAAEAVDQ